MIISIPKSNKSIFFNSYKALLCYCKSNTPPPTKFYYELLNFSLIKVFFNLKLSAPSHNKLVRVV
jgi:hypothetical protein